jgi:peptidoglycan/LPS O-acetylase OafA/YrhL
MANNIAALLHGRDNNFNLIRFLAASAVILDHSFALVAPERAAAAPVDFEALELARVAVDVFFIVSGFLVTRSVLTQPTLVDYAVARFLRLFPALLATCIFIAFLLGPAVTSVPLAEYFSDPRTWLYVPLTASLVTHSLTLPGVFEHVPEAGLIDPPLWTLRYETACYILLAAFAVVGLLATRARASATLAAIFAAYLLVTFATTLRQDIAAVDSMARFVLCFFVGGAFYLYADKIRLDWRIAVALALAAVLTVGTGAFEAAFRVALAYGVLWFALVPGGVLRRFNLIGDYSYGLYILCFPIQQTFVAFDPGIGPGALFACSFPAVLAVAILSWHFIEHPALRQKAWAGDSVGSLLRGGQQRLTVLLGRGAAPKVQRSTG